MNLPTKQTAKRIYLPEIVGKGYKAFWNCKKPYRVVKGSRASKKSKTTALNFICRIVEYPQANLLVVRKTYRSLKDSCFVELRWAINRLGLDDWFDSRENPLEITYKPTGQKILFRGLDDPLKVTSIAVERGALCWLWLEECYEVANEEDFDILNESIRGVMPDGLFRQLTLTLNPWSDRHWVKRRFFDEPPDPEDVFTLTTNYTCNEWLSEQDLKVFETMKAYNPRRYRTAGLGEWGAVDGLVFENFEKLTFNVDTIRKLPGIVSVFGLDFGYTHDPSALFCGLVDKGAQTIYVFDEMYERGLTNKEMFARICEKGYRKEIINADSSDPRLIDELRALGLTRIRNVRKPKGSIMTGIQYIQNFHICIHPKCVNFIDEINNYAWKKDKFGQMLNEPMDENNHLMDGFRYACSDMSMPVSTFSGVNSELGKASYWG